jgi:hypothetical protein
VRDSRGREPVGGAERVDARQHTGYFRDVEHGHARVSGLYEVILQGFVVKYLSQNAFPLARLA